MADDDNLDDLRRLMLDILLIGVVAALAILFALALLYMSHHWCWACG